MGIILSTIDRDTPVPELLGPDGQVLLLPDDFYSDIARYNLWDGVRLWCHQHARYGLPTVELVSWLKDEIGVRLAIEIGAGSGDLCHYLGCKGTDSHLQAVPSVAAQYKAGNQPTVTYGRHVEALTAEQAILKYRPEVVIACWVTQFIDLSAPPDPGNTVGSPCGVREDRIVNAGMTYILIGNEMVHGDKRIMSIPHETLMLPFVRSRSAFPDKDRIWIWNR